MKYVFAILLLFPTTLLAEKIQPEPYCKKLPFNEKEPPGIIGRYEIVGKNGETGQPYAGDLSISVEKNAYALRKTVGSKSIKGSAWEEVCSPDKFKILVVQYQLESNTEKFSCYVRFDGDNFIRANCTSFGSHGLEAWYQRHDIQP